MKRLHLILGVFLIVWFGAPDEAVAWGPGMHIGLARSVLDNLAWLPAAVAAVLSRNAVSYLYGNIAADVVFAKRLSRVKQFCHHWSTGFRLLQDANEPPKQAFAYGYLSHLAADTVAHGKFVPRQILISRSSIGFGHLYWEIRADLLEDRRTIQQLGELLELDHSRYHSWLEKHITDTFLPYPLNRELFHRISAAAVRRELLWTLDIRRRFPRWHLSKRLLDGYRAESLDRIHSILRDGPSSTVVRDDPNGTSALMRLRVRRREMRRLARRGLPLQHRLNETLRTLVPAPILIRSEEGRCDSPREGHIHPV